ncbi:MAG TPA: glycosyltransferase [Solirubrobacteraceae bacterium]|nr:glycosyltransferase [Solirubrobacteraceae bacterium]
MRESATVVIPARDAAAQLPATLAPLAGADVVVVDNASRDDTAAVARAHGARVVHEPRPSRARARNAGAAATGAPLLAFLDAGCVPRPGWLEALTACLARADLAGGAVEVRTSEAPTPAERFDAAWRFRQERNVAAGWSVSANLGVRREAFERVGGFDAAYRHVGEDVDFCLRATAAGARLAYCPAAVVEHDAERTIPAVLRRAFWQGWSSVQHAERLPGRAGRRYWRHPRPAVAGDYALRALGIEDRRLLRIARLDYAARVAGSLWAEARRVR